MGQLRMDNIEKGNIRLKTRNEEKQNNKHNLEKCE